MKTVYKSLVSLLLIAGSLSGNGATPIDVVAPGPHVLFEVRNVVVVNGSSPSITFDLYVSASQAYVDYITVNGPSRGLQNVDVAYDVDFGTDGTTTLTTASPATPTGLGSMAANATATNGFTGASASPYDSRFKISITRSSGVSAEFTTTPTKILTETVNFPNGTVIGTVLNNARIQIRNANSLPTAYGTGANSSKWADFSGGTANAVGNSKTAAQPLPVALIDFTAKKADNRRTQLNWQTATEQNTDHFEVERSADGNGFGTAIRLVPAAGNSTTKLDYQTYDNDPAKGINYYRLKMVDKNGAFTYSKVQSVIFDDAIHYSLNPNPAIDKIAVSGMEMGAVINITSPSGQFIKHVIAENRVQSVDIDELAAGMYYVQIIQNGVIVHTEKFLKK